MLLLFTLLSFHRCTEVDGGGWGGAAVLPQCGYIQRGGVGGRLGLDIILWSLWIISSTSLHVTGNAFVSITHFRFESDLKTRGYGRIKYILQKTSEVRIRTEPQAALQWFLGVNI